jgi:hypothetical protein
MAMTLFAAHLGIGVFKVLFLSVQPPTHIARCEQFCSVAESAVAGSMVLAIMVAAASGWW